MLARRTPMRRTGWRRRAGVSSETPVASMRPVAPAPPVTRLARPANYAPATGHATALKKDAAARSEAYRRIVAAMPCAHCGIAGYSQHAHANAGKGKGIKTDDRAGFPLCAPRPGIEGCHAAFDQYRLLPGGRDAHVAAGRAWGARTRAAVEKAGKWPARLPRWGNESGPTGTTA